MQNSLPSGSANATHDWSPWPTSAREAPSPSIRSTSIFRSTGRKSKWSRFFTVFGSGTRAKSRPGSRSGAGRISNSSGSSFTTTHPSASCHQRPSATGSRASTFVCSHSKPMLLNLGRSLLAAERSLVRAPPRAHRASSTGHHESAIGARAGSSRMGIRGIRDIRDCPPTARRELPACGNVSRRAEGVRPRIRTPGQPGRRGPTRRRGRSCPRRPPKSRTCRQRRCRSPSARRPASSRPPTS